MTDDNKTNHWHLTCEERFSAPQQMGTLAVDLVVIGGGFTGLSAALTAVQTGAQVAVIEAREIGHGGSGRNVGLANAGLWMPPEDINTVLGADQGAKLSKILAEAPARVFGLIEQCRIDCEPVRNGTLHCAHAPVGMKDLENRYRQMTAIGAPVQLLDQDEARRRTGSEAVFGALFDPRAGTIQPLAYAKGLARAAKSAGAQIFENSPATALRHEGGQWHVETAQGVIKAKSLLQATNGYLDPIKGYQAPSTIPVHYFQAATEPLSAPLREKILKGQEGCWDSALVMSSWRLDQQGRLIIGAMGQLGHFASGIHTSWLRRKLTALYPELANIRLNGAWHGRIAMTTEHLPKVLSFGPNALAVFGYSGRGIGPGTLFGAASAEALIGENFDGLPVEVSPSHSLPFAVLRGTYYETGATLMHFIKNR